MALYLSKKQIRDFIERLGQPKASVLLNSFFNSYRKTLHSHDVSPLYDDEYLERIRSLEPHAMVQGKYKIHIYSRYAYEYLSPRIGAENHVLDVGCGNGDFALALASQTGATVLGIDFSAQAIQEAAEKAKKDNLPCHFFCQGVAELSGGKQFDCVVLNDVIEHLSDKELEELFGKFHDVLVPKGELVIHTPNGLALCNDTDTHWIQRAYKAYLKFRRGWEGLERSAEQIYYDQLHINIKSFPQLRNFLNKQGFHARVLYDETKTRSLQNALSSNMLVLAHRLKDCRGLH